MEGLQTLYSGRIDPEIIPHPAPLRLLTPKAPTIDIPVSWEGLAVTEAEFLEDWYDVPDVIYEWCNGILEEKPVSDLEGWLMGQWFITLLTMFLEIHPMARMFGTDIGFRLNFAENVSIRRPDVALILNQNPVGIHLKDAFYKGTCDLCVEFLSHSKPSGVKRDTVQKKKEYAGSGVQEYYILDSKGKETVFYRLNENRIYQPIPPVNGDIIQSGVLPGLQFRMRDVYDCPSLETLMRDPVYQHYVLPGYQEAESRLVFEKLRAEQAETLLELEKQRAEQEKQRAEQEKQRAEQADLRVAKMAAKLKELGISPNDLA